MYLQNQQSQLKKQQHDENDDVQSEQVDEDAEDNKNTTTNGDDTASVPATEEADDSVQDFGSEEPADAEDRLALAAMGSAAEPVRRKSTKD